MELIISSFFVAVQLKLTFAIKDVCVKGMNIVGKSISKQCFFSIGFGYISLYQIKFELAFLKKTNVTWMA
jgi:hypothetical protein